MKHQKVFVLKVGTLFLNLFIEFERDISIDNQFLVPFEVHNEKLTQEFIENQQGIIYCNHTAVNNNIISNITWIFNNQETNVNTLQSDIVQDNDRLIFRNLSRYRYDGSYYCEIILNTNDNVQSDNNIEVFVSCKRIFFMKLG